MEILALSLAENGVIFCYNHVKIYKEMYGYPDAVSDTASGSHTCLF